MLGSLSSRCKVHGLLGLRHIYILSGEDGGPITLTGLLLMSEKRSQESRTYKVVSDQRLFKGLSLCVYQKFYVK